MIRLALVQMLIEGAALGANIERAVARIRETAAQGAEVVLLPEVLDVGWTHPAARELAESIPGGMAYEALAAAAKECGVFVCAGLSEREGDRLYNSAVLIDSAGKLLLKHRKINELEIGHDLYGLGQKLEVCQTPLGAIGVVVCADAFARDRCLLRALGYMGADIVLSPSAWAVPPEHTEDQPYGRIWHDSYQPLSKDFQMPIAGVSGVGPLTEGPWKGYRAIGSSLLYNADGEVQARGPYEKEWLSIQEVDLRPRPSQGCAWVDRWGEGYSG